ncbi:MAG: hypothetical protein WBF33_08525 [Candidatus Nitrosopolaris sp.]
MKTPICTFDAKTSILCTKCETKLRLGQLTDADVDGAIKIAKLAEASQDVNNFTYVNCSSKYYRIVALRLVGRIIHPIP